MSVRWHHCIDHADKHSKARRLTRLSSRRSSAADRQSVKRETTTAFDDLGTLLVIASYLLPQFRGTRGVTVRLLVIKT